MLWLQTNTDDCGMLNLGGSLTRQFEKQSERFPSHSHICEIGKLVEEAENKVNNTFPAFELSARIASLEMPVSDLGRPQGLAPNSKLTFRFELR